MTQHARNSRDAHSFVSIRHTCTHACTMWTRASTGAAHQMRLSCIFVNGTELSRADAQRLKLADYHGTSVGEIKYKTQYKRISRVLFHSGCYTFILPLRGPKSRHGNFGVECVSSRRTGTGPHYGVLREWGGLTGRPRLKTCITTKCASLCVCVCVFEKTGDWTGCCPRPLGCV